MLVLSRKLGESIQIDSHITITVLDLGRGRVRLGIEAPRSVGVHRHELLGRPAPLAHLPPTSSCSIPTAAV